MSAKTLQAAAARVLPARSPGASFCRGGISSSSLTHVQAGLGQIGPIHPVLKPIVSEARRALHITV